MIRTLLLPALCLLFAACSSGEPPAATATSGTDPAADRTTEPVAIRQDTVVSDAIAYTVDQTPEAQTGDELPPAPTSSQAKNPAPAPRRPERQPVAPPPPTNDPAPSPATTPAPAPAKPHVDHAPFDALLGRYVDDRGRVDYRGLARDEAKLDAYLATLAAETPGQDWPRNEALAYWINAYNAYTLKLVLDNYPLESIRDLDKPWDRKWIKLGGKTYGLNQIEHEIIRPRFNEPRIHFALVCAAVSCPPLADEAFTAANLNQLLDRRTRRFLRNERFNVTQEEVVRLSPLFDWYGEDFGDVREYVNRYLERPIPAGAPINFLDYDWSLNERE